MKIITKQRGNLLFCEICFRFAKVFPHTLQQKKVIFSLIFKKMLLLLLLVANCVYAFLRGNSLFQKYPFTEMLGLFAGLVQCNEAHCSAVQCSAVDFCEVHFSAVPFSAVLQHIAVQCSEVKKIKVQCR